MGHTRLSADGREMAALLALGRSAVLSHSTAAVRWDLVLSATSRIHLTLPTTSGLSRRPGIVVHRSRTLTPGDVTTHEGFPVTAVARTLLDLAATFKPGPLERAVERAIALRHFDRTALHDVIQRNRTRRGATALTTAIAGVHDEPRITRSELEALMRDLCDAHRIARPEVNARVEGCEVDFLWREHRLIVETDGHEHHGTRSAFERDRARDARLTALGHRVVRFTYRQVVREPELVAATLRALRATAPR